MRKTKIVCTLGPATESFQNIKNLIKAGMNVARFNMSHGTYEEHRAKIENVKKAREELDTPISLLLDTKGPEIRIKTFEKGKICLCDGDKFTLDVADAPGTKDRISVSYKNLSDSVKCGDQILLNDGNIELKACDVKKGCIVCETVHGGELSDQKSINLPNTVIDMPYMSEIDKQDLLFGIAEDVDYIALSFVRSGNDVKNVRDFLRVNGGEKIQLISKIENRQGVDNIDGILEMSDGIMVARGDMGVEIPFEELPSIQKMLIRKCYQMGKRVITATQMLESMINNPRPTRAEISDVANAIYDGTSATMLSGETAVGKFPFETVKAMSKIAEKTESSIDFKQKFKNLDVTIKSITDAVSHSAVAAAYDLKAQAIITVTQSGYTARKVSRFRPDCVIIGATTDKKVYNQLALNWGVVPVMSKNQTTSDELFSHSVICAKSTGMVKDGDLVVIVGSTKVGSSGLTNTLRIENV